MYVFIQIIVITKNIIINSTNFVDNMFITFANNFVFQSSQVQWIRDT